MSCRFKSCCRKTIFYISRIKTKLNKRDVFYCFVFHKVKNTKNKPFFLTESRVLRVFLTFSFESFLSKKEKVKKTQKKHSFCLVAFGFSYQIMKKLSRKGVTPLKWGKKRGTRKLISNLFLFSFFIKKSNEKRPEPPLIENWKILGRLAQ